MLSVIAIIALVVNFLFMLLHRVGVVERLQMSRFKLLSDMANCEFCLTFWITLTCVTVFSCFVTFDWVSLVLLLASTSLAMCIR